MRLQPAILSGGAGTRLWPLSREAYPKQFLPLVGQQTMLQQTVARLDGLSDEHPHHGIAMADPLVVCNESHRFLVAEQLMEAGREAAAIILEPVGRNTAPALTLAALAAVREGEDPILIAMPADHVVADLNAFHRAVAEGCLLASEGAVITFGIVPAGPETGYGYILRGAPRKQADTACRLERFVEKPDRDTAAHYVVSGDYLWNSGIFMLRAGRWLGLIERFRPDIAEACREAYSRAKADLDFCRVDAQAFRDCPSDSIDYAVMERLSAESSGDALVLPLDAGWSDVGAWCALWDVGERDEADNVVHGDVFVYEGRGNLIYAQSRMVAGVGVEGLIVVETPDAVLVVDKEHTQDVKAVTGYLKAARRQECEFHRRVHRPWGTYEPVDGGPRYQVKRLTVKPGASLSLQLHHHRAEHWIVVSGTARVTRDDEVFLVSENQSTYIPIGTRHRLENPGTIPLELIEVQSGSYLGEDDIVRLEDKYNRTSPESRL